MNTAIVPMFPTTTTRTRTESRAKTLDVMVVTLGLVVALGGFFSRTVTWAFLGA